MTSPFSDEVNNKLSMLLGGDGCKQIVDLGNMAVASDDFVLSMSDGSATGLSLADMTVISGLSMYAASSINMGAGSTIVTTGAGFKIGGAASQKIGFWGVNPVIQPTKANYTGNAAWSTTFLASVLFRAGIIDRAR